MKKADVEIDGVYYAKVSGKVARVKITYAYERTVFGGGRTQTRTAWKAVNLDTGREVTIKSAARLRWAGTQTA